MTRSGLYIHIPFCTAKCSYCDFASFSLGEREQRAYVDALKQEIRLRATGIDGESCVVRGESGVVRGESGVVRSECGVESVKSDTGWGVFDTVFIGGGTPSALFLGGLSEILAEIRANFKLEISEFTVEANPETVTPAFVGECVKMGVNRVSLGLQTASDSLLKGLRRHTFADFLHAVNLFRAGGVDNISADLMLGLPGQTAKDVRDSIARLRELGLGHISVYALKVEEGTRLFYSGFKEDEDYSAELFEVARASLLDKYVQYEVSNFALSGHECRHNFKYWTMQPYLGLGLSASSFDGQKRRTNTCDFGRYLRGEFDDFLEDASSNFLTEYIMLGLRTNRGICMDFIKKHGILPQKLSQINQFVEKGVFIKEGDSIRLNPNYYFVMNSILSEIL